MTLWRVETVKTVGNTAVTEYTLFNVYEHSIYCFNACKASGTYTAVRHVTIVGGITETIIT